MRSPDNLYELIHNLTGNEKRYYKLFASKQQPGKKNQYLRLFDAIEKQKEYNEDELISALKNDSVLKNFHYNKHYLYQHILKALSLFHSEISVNAKLKEELVKAEILFWKGLYKHAYKILSQAKKVAKKYEKHLVLLEILDWESRIASASIDIERAKNQIENDVIEENNLLKEFSNSLKYKHLRMKMHLLIKTKPYPQTKEDKESYKESIIKNPLLGERVMPSDFLSRYDYIVMRGVYYGMIGDMEKAFSYIKQLVKWVEQNHEQIQENPVKYTAALHNQMMISLNLKKHESFVEALNKLKNLKVKSYHMQSVIFATSHIHELMYYNLYGMKQGGLKALDEVFEGMEKYKAQLNKEDYLQFWFEIFKIYFLAGQYNKALPWLNNILNDREMEIRQDMRCIAAIVNLIIHYELGNYDLLEYAIKSTYRYLYKRRSLFNIEKAVIDFIKMKVAAAESGKENTKSLSKIRERLIKILNDPGEKRISLYFDFVSWLDSKIENKPFAEIISEKVNEKSRFIT
jgi:hypothetical protein